MPAITSPRFVGAAAMVALIWGHAVFVSRDRDAHRVGDTIDREKCQSC